MRAPALPGAACVLALCLAAAPSAQAQAHADLDLVHPVRSGDTLYGLARHYLGDARLWPQLQHANAVREPRHLQPATQLRIPMRLLPAGSAQVVFASGATRVAPGAVAQPLHAGQALAEGEAIRAAPDGFISVRLADGTLVRVQADSQLRIEQLRRTGRAGDAQSILQLQRGSVDSSVPPRPGSARRFEVRTPGASTAVRGTRFTVELDAQGRTLAAVTEGRLAVAPHSAGSAAVDTGQGLVVGDDGRPGQRQALLPAPGLQAVADTLEDADLLYLPLQSVGGATAYQVQLARDAQFTQVLRGGRFDSAELRLPAVADGSYYLQARAIDAHGLPGWPAQRSITVKAHPIAPLLQQPAAGASLERGAGALSCTPVAGVTRYRIQVAAAAGFAAPVLDTLQDGCALALAALPPGRYEWRAASVRQRPDGVPDQGPFSAPRAFAVAERPPPPEVVAEQSGDRLQLRWQGHAGQRFQLQLATSAGFEEGSVVLDEQLDAAAWAAPSSALAGAYHLRLRTLDPSGLRSGFSTPRLIILAAPVVSGDGLPVRSADGQPVARP
ncbi:FecR family protein [Oryzisolibacter propanilivorax]|uniref:FecR family protein n=1 Tax=Oryzisolibacter propanilivorax TaxID=1527607 RepID=A0A1G9RGM3_9BURK|nr:FecR domain-containing protein [Oryzisolibacter propanilivorax]SDM22386.1 FecR family protein [Oryzisolibacter propanilivorax]